MDKYSWHTMAKLLNVHDRILTKFLTNIIINRK